MPETCPDSSGHGSPTRPKVKGKEPVRLKLASLARTDPVDLSRIRGSKIPVVVVRYGEGYLVADGNHRVAKARERGKRTILGWVLEEGDKIVGTRGWPLAKFSKGEWTLQELTERLAQRAEETVGTAL